MKNKLLLLVMFIVSVTQAQTVLISNGGFNTDTSGWSIAGNNTSINSSGGELYLNVSGGFTENFVLTSPQFYLDANKTYKLYTSYKNSSWDPVMMMEQPLGGFWGVNLKDTNGTTVQNVSLTNFSLLGYLEEGSSGSFSVTTSGIYYLDYDGQHQSTDTFIIDNVGFREVIENTFSGKVTLDVNNDGCATSSTAVENFPVQLTETNTNISYNVLTDVNGDFSIGTSVSGNFVTQTNNTLYNATPANYTNTISAGTNNITNQDFCITPNTIVDDVSVLIIPTSDARPGFNSSYQLQYTNTGSTTVSGNVELTFENNKMHSLTATPSITSTSTTSTITTLLWGYTNLLPFETRTIDVGFTNNTPTQTTNPLNGGDLLNFTANITPLTSDVNQSDNNFTLVQPVVNSYDPNDATILEGSQITAVQATQDLHFRIRFQNTGTASAININVKTLLDVDLDWSTFTPISASHTYTTSVNSTTGEVNFNFPGINLADSTSNEPASHGWVLFKAKPKSTFAIGDMIDCGADIFFDYNFPIVTNVASTQIFVPSLYTLIPDSTFEQALLDLGIDSENTLDGQVLTSDISGITTLDISDPLNNTSLPNVTAKISDMTGIQDFAALQSLNCYNNLIANLDLSSNTALTYVKCDSNQLTNINVTNSPNLNFLACNVNLLPALDVTQNTNLTILDCDTNQIPVLDVTNNPILHSLDCDGNLLTGLITSSNPLLYTLACSSNQITNLNVSLNTKLNAFACRDNLLTSLDLTTNVDLEILDFGKNSIPAISLINNTKLQILNGAENLLTVLDVKLNTVLENLTCNDNPNLSSLNIANGNNVNFTFFQSQNSPNLTCITADAATPANGYTSNWYKDPAHTFSATCGSVLNPDVYTVAEDTVLSVNGTNGIFANDVIVGLLLGITQFEVEGNVYSPAGIATTSAGTIQIENLGSFIFTPADNFCGPVPQITYSALDENGINTITSTLDITVTCVNDVPICTSENNIIAEDTTLTVLAASGLLANDTDADGDTLTVSDIVVQGTSFTVGAAFGATGIGSITIFSDGSYNFTPDQDFNGNFFPIDYTISDGNGGTSTCTLNITVTPVNDVPICTSENNTIAEDTTLTVLAASGLLANDTDVDGDVLTILDIIVGGSNYTVGVSFTMPEGDLKIESDGSYLFTPFANFNGVLPTITYTISDGTSTATCTLDITVTPVNDVPVCTSDLNTIAEDTTLTVAAINGLLANDTDVDGDTLIITDIILQGISFPLGAPFGYGGTNSVIIYGDGSYSFTPDTNFTGNFPAISYTISDGNGGFSTCTLDVTVTPVNDAPIAVDDVISGNTGNVITANDTDVDGTIDVTTITLIDPNNTSNTGNRLIPLVISGIGIFTIDVSGNITFTADASFTGTIVTLNYTVNDNDGLTSNTAVITFTLSTCTVTLIPDSNFEQTLINQNIDTDGLLNGQVCTSDINTITSLSMNYKSISDLTGIEDFTALKQLYMEGNSVANPDFSQNLLLEELNMNSCQVSIIDITKNLQLKRLELFENNLNTIDVSKNILLEVLFLGKNSLATIDVSSNTELVDLGVGRNSLTQLNLVNNTKLISLIVEQNSIVKLDVSMLPVLNNLDADNNKLIQLNIANGNNTNFIGFNSRFNTGLTCIQTDTNTAPAGNVQIDTAHVFNANCSNVWVINTATATTAALAAIAGIDTNMDGEITLAEAAAFVGALNLSGANITNVAGLQAFTGITLLDLSGNPITDLSPLFSGSVTIIVRKSANNESKKVAVTSMALEKLIVKNTLIEGVNLNELTSLKEIDLSDNPNLVTVSIKNGNNANITAFDSSNTPNLTCIIVDDVNAGYLSTWTKDVKSTFVSGEADCRARVLSIDNYDISSQVSLYPNPVKEYLTIQLSNQLELKKIEVINIIGKTVMTFKEEKINLNDLSEGVYLLRIITNKGIVTQKIIKE